MFLKIQKYVTTRVTFTGFIARTAKWANNVGKTKRAPEGALETRMVSGFV